MLNFLQAKGSYFLTFLVAFLLLATFAVVPTSADEVILSEDQDVEIIEWDEGGREVWREAVEEAEERDEWLDEEEPIYTTMGEEDGEGYGEVSPVIIFVVIAVIVLVAIYTYMKVAKGKNSTKDSNTM